MKIFKCQMVYSIFARIWTVLALSWGNPRTTPPPTHTHTSIELDCVLCSDTTMKFKKNYSSYKTFGCPEPPPPFPSENILDPLRHCIGTRSRLFLSGPTKPLLIKWTAQSFPVYCLLLVPHSSGRWYCGTARQAPPWTPPPPYFPELGASPPGKGISGKAASTDPVGKPKLLSLFIKQTQFRFNREREPSRKFENFHRKPTGQCNTQTVPWCQKSVLFLVKKIQILNKRSRLWTKEDKLVKLHTDHIFITYRIKIYSLPLLRVSG